MARFKPRDRVAVRERGPFHDHVGTVTALRRDGLVFDYRVELDTLPASHANPRFPGEHPNNWTFSESELDEAIRP